MVDALPSGTVTFLFTDIEGSTRLWDVHGEAMTAVLARHDEVLRQAITGCGGVVFKHTGDGLGAAFAHAGGAIRAAVSAQRALDAEDWGPVDAVRVRMGVHTGEAAPDDGDYHAPAVNHAARIEAVTNGGHIVVSAATLALAEDALADGVEARDLGSHELRGVTRRVRLHQVVASDIARSTPALRLGSVVVGNLPASAGALVGREADMADLVSAIESGAVVTLTGVGGVGKTSLALEAARGAAVSFEGGAWLVELAPVVERAGVVDAVRNALDFPPPDGADARAALVAGLATAPRLLVLDNCEHLVDDVCDLVEHISRTCPLVAVVATSREPLGVVGEQVRRVRSLALPEDAPGERSASVELFLQRAGDAAAAVEQDAASIELVGEICRRLDGIPLAIELAAARTRSMGLREIGERLDERFHLLTGGRRTAVERHQTLQAAVEWSYRLLDDSAQRVFERLAVFVGPFTLDGAEAVGAGDGVDRLDIIDLLADLVDKSMVNAVAVGGSLRYSMLETMRQFAQGRLEESGTADDVRRRHAEWIIGLFEELGSTGFTDDLPQAVARWRSELDDFLAAHAWAVSVADATTATALLGAAPAFLMWHDNFPQFMDLGPDTLALGIDDDHPSASAVYAVAARTMSERLEVVRAGEYACRGVAVGRAQHSLVVGWCYQIGSRAANLRGDHHEALRLNDEWIEWASSAPVRAQGGDEALIWALVSGSQTAHYAGDDEHAAPFLDRALSLLENAHPDHSARAIAHFSRAEMLGDEDPAAAHFHYREAMKVGAVADSMFAQFIRSGELSLIARTGSAEEALVGFGELLRYWRDHGMAPSLWITCRNLVDLFIRIGEDEVAATVHGFLRTLATDGLTDHQQKGIVAVESRLDAAVFEAAVARGRALSPVAAVALCLDTIDRLTESPS